ARASEPLPQRAAVAHLVHFLERAAKREALRGDAEGEHAQRKERVFEPLVARELVPALVDREEAAEAEEHDGDHERPEVDLLAEAERVLERRRALRAF